MHVPQAPCGAAPPYPDGEEAQASTIDGTQGQGGATEAWADAWRRIEDEARGVGSFVA